MALGRSQADPIERRLCREFVLKIHFRGSGPLSETRSGICGERKLVVELVRGGQRRRAKKRLAGVDVGAGGELDHFPGSFARGWIEPEETVRGGHRDECRAECGWLSARYGNRLNQIAPLPSGPAPLNVGMLASKPRETAPHRSPQLSFFRPQRSSRPAAAQSIFPLR